MQVSRKLQSKILRTKKRLSKEHWQRAMMPLALLMILTVSFIGYRVTSLPIDYSLVRGDIPVVPVGLSDATLHKFVEAPSKNIDELTPTIVMDDEGNLFFGNLKAFSTDYHDVRNKYVIKAQNGSPQTADLLATMRRWLDEREQKIRKKSDGVAILVPASGIPMPLVIKVMAELRYSDIFDRVILANGIM